MHHDFRYAGRTRLVAVLLVAALMALPLGATQGDIPVPQTRLTPRLEQAVARGLAFLAKTQQADGSWPGGYGQSPGVVGLIVLSFLAHGEHPADGLYGEVMRRAVNYILKSQQENGLLSGGRGSAMYNHGFATLALAEIYGQMDDPRIGPALKKAVGLIISAQNAHGGWRYSVGSHDSDTTVSGAQMIALRAAATGGMEVPLETIQRGVAYYRTCFCSGGGYGYTSPGSPNMVRSGIGLLVLSLSGAYRDPQAKATADWLYRSLQPSATYYTGYYCSQAMFQAGGKYWQQWNEVMTPLLMAMQQPDGSWLNRSGGFSGNGGPACCTAMALLALEVNYNYLPIYQR